MSAYRVAAFVMSIAVLCFIAIEAGPFDEHDKMITDTASKNCLQLRDEDTWDTYENNLSGVGTPWSLSSVIASGLNRQGPTLTSGSRPFAPSAPVGYKNGFRWNDGDMAVDYWIPQGMTAGVAGDSNVVMVAWHYEPESGGRGVRVSIADVTDMSAASVPYRHALLVEPHASGDFREVRVHAGGIAWVGHYLYMVETNVGIRVFDLNLIREVNTSSACGDAIGLSGSVYCAYGYRFIIPQVSRYYVPSAKSDGSAIPASCKPRFSTLGKDTRNSPDVLLMAEYCNATDTACDLDSTYGVGMGGRLYRWPLGSDGRLAASATPGGYVSPQKVYIMNERNIQGVAPVMTQVDGAYLPDTYWLSSTRRNGALFRVSQTASAKAWYADESDFPWIPEGMHGTASGTNLWVATEGRRDSSGNIITNPATGGRVVIYVAQSSVD
jgi:hypothetical protein